MCCHDHLGCAGMGNGPRTEISRIEMGAARWEENGRDGNWIAVLILDCWIAGLVVQSCWVAACGCDLIASSSPSYRWRRDGCVGMGSVYRRDRPLAARWEKHGRDGSRIAVLMEEGCKRCHMKNAVRWF